MELRTARPLVHHITNYVTINDCANITLCIGASPVMADAPEEMAEMVSLAGALVLNIGTLNSRTVESMLLAGKVAKEKDIPIILDPVGAGATSYRTQTAQMLIEQLSPAIIKGNAGEISVLAGAGGVVKGGRFLRCRGGFGNCLQSFSPRDRRCSGGLGQRRYRY